MTKKYMTIYLDETTVNALEKMRKLGFSKSEVIELGVTEGIKKIFHLINKAHSKKDYRSKILDIACGGATLNYKDKYP